MARPTTKTAMLRLAAGDTGDALTFALAPPRHMDPLLGQTQRPRAPVTFRPGAAAGHAHVTEMTVHDAPRVVIARRHIGDAEQGIFGMMVLPLPLSRRAIASAIGLALFAASLAAPRPAAAQLGAFGTDQRYCDRSALQKILSTSTGNLLGSAAGGAIGGLLGSNIGKGSGNTLATIVGVLGGALAGGYIGRSMDPADQACVNQALEHTPTNQTIAWQNPDNGSSYWVTPTQSYQGSGGEPCRDYVTDAIVDGQRQEMHGTACRQRDGSWRTASGGSAA